MKSINVKIISFCMVSFFCQKALSQAAGTPYIPYTPSFTITKCTGTGSTLGWLATEVPANSADIVAEQQIEVNVRNPGPYNFVTTAVNGVTFSASGNFTTPGIQSLNIKASGTPVNYTINDNVIDYTVTNATGTNAGSCSFGRKVYVGDQGYANTNAGAGNHRFIYKVITGPSGREWLQTNLGSLYNKVGSPDFNPDMYAQNVNDYKAFGSLFQVGRKSDGHELTNWTSATTATFPMGTTNNNIINPTATNSGLFIVSTATDEASNRGDLNKILDRELRIYTVGPYQPCPTGFVIAKMANDPSEVSYFAEEGILYNGTAATAVNSSLKLISPMMYRNAANGQLTSLPYRIIRSDLVGLYPLYIGTSPQFVISGGSFFLVSSYIDRRYYLNNIDHRGARDGYPIRCSKY